MVYLGDIWLGGVLVVVSRDPEIFHHLPAPALGGSFGALTPEGGQIVEVTRALVPPGARGRDPEHGPGKRSTQVIFYHQRLPPLYP